MVKNILRVKINNTWFVGQYAHAVTKLIHGGTVTIADFKNSRWTPTKQIGRFIYLLEDSYLDFTKDGKSLSKTKIKINENNHYDIFKKGWN